MSITALPLHFFTLFGWLQGLDYNTDDASTIEDRNALALAIVPSDPGHILARCFSIMLHKLFCMVFYSHSMVLLLIIAGTAPTFDSNVIQAKDFDPTGWELALVTTPSSNISSVNERQLVGPYCLSLLLFVLHTFCGNFIIYRFLTRGFFSLVG